MMYLDQLTPQLLAQNIGKKTGSLHVVTGGMKANKSAITLGLYQRLGYTNIKVQLFKPVCDYRPELHEKFHFPKHYSVSRTGLGYPATELDDKGDLSDLLEKIDPKADMYGFSEVHLYNQRQKLVEIMLYLKNEEKRSVVADMLDRDFRGEMYAEAAELMAHATTVDKVYGFCEIKDCNNIGEFSQRLIEGKPAHFDSPVKVVGDEDYQARCYLHHVVPGKPQAQPFSLRQKE